MPNYIITKKVLNWNSQETKNDLDHVEAKEGSELFMFAEATVVLSKCLDPILTHVRPQKYIDLLKEFLQKWRIQINVDKTLAIIFSKRRQQLPQNVIINDQIILWNC